MINVSIVTYHTPEQQLRTITEILRQSEAVKHVEVIDNGQGINRGYGAAHNIAIRKTLEEGTPYHLVVNADIRFEPGILKELEKYMDEHPDAGSLMPRVIYPDGRLQYLCKLLPTPMDVFGRRFLPKKWNEKRNERFEMRQSGYDKVMNVPYLSGCFMLLRTEALKQCGIFDERFFMYPEDIDLTRRIHRHFQTVYYPHCTIVHDHAQGSYKSGKLLWIHMWNLCKYFTKWGWLFDKERTAFNKEAEQHYLTDK
ncbi:MAG: glycosyltransferase family 2 protein [Bacteroidales bacterium]|nr:glycosyltransferase family 2 protein [Candidatus Colicola faecequi]